MSRSRKGRSPRVSKGARSPTQSRSGPPGPRRAARNARPTALVPSLGKKCGRREEEAGAGATCTRDVTVEGTLASRNVSPFAGRHGSGGLGRSVSFVRGSSPAGDRAGDSGVSPGRRGGERRRRTQPRRTHPSRAAPPAPRLGDASFTRSRDPRTVVSRAHALGSLAQARGSELGDAARDRSRKGRGASRGALEGHGAGQVRISWANWEKSRRNHGRDWVVRMLRGSPRVGTRHLLERGSVHGARCVRTGTEVEASFHEREDTESPGPSARTSWQLQKSSGVVRSRISSRGTIHFVPRPPKRGPARVNGDLARRGRRQPASQGALCRPSRRVKGRREPGRIVLVSTRVRDRGSPRVA